MSRKDPQINVRLASDREAILRAAAFVHDKATPGALVHELVEEAIDQYAKLPAVKTALKARAEQMATNEGKLTHLSQAPGHSAARPRSKSSP
jgi:uncharacterized protein (DUF1778 family)